MAIFQVKNLTFTYPNGASPALKDIGLSLNGGEFMALCGRSGCGKSTLLRHLKSPLTPYGSRSGEILFEGEPIEKADRRRQASAVGFVQQNPDSQLVCDKVWHELAFGLESLGCENGQIRLRVAEMASFFGIEGWFHKDVAALSGGQKQLLNLASIMAMEPSVLLLDEPTSQLDPVAAMDFLNTLKRINQELGTAVLLSEHRLAEVLPLADQMAVLEEGRILALGPPREVGFSLFEKKHPLFRAMPAPMQIFLEAGGEGKAPLTVGEGRRWLNQRVKKEAAPVFQEKEEKKKNPLQEAALTLKEVWFGYEKKGPDVIRGADLTVFKGELFALLGPNGSGKSTLLSLAAGLLRPYRGKALLSGAAALLPQAPLTLFTQNRLEKDLAQMLGDRGLSEKEKKEQIAEACEKMELSQAALASHPYDLSGGEQQRAAVAKLLLANPQILLLDEPTKGMDAIFKESFARLLEGLAKEGKALFLVSHDIEFCASFAHRCGLFFDGQVAACAPPKEFFSNNSFYTTGASRMTRRLFPGAVTVSDAVRRMEEGL